MRKFPKLGKLYLVSSFIFYSLGIVWLVLELLSSEFIFYKSYGIFYSILGSVFLGFAFHEKNRLVHITLENIQKKLYERNFPENFVEEIMKVLEKQNNKMGHIEFQKWFGTLHYCLPKECENELFASTLYKRHCLFVEEEIKKLEKETNLSWGKQTEDLADFNEKARKVLLVIRHRLSDIALDLTY